MALYHIQGYYLYYVLFIVMIFISFVLSDSKWKYPGRPDVRFEDVTSSCGLSENGLSILAIGDFNSDRYDDYFILDDNDNSVSVYLWNRNDFKFEVQEYTKIVYNSSIKVLNAIPSDYDRDGKLDVLISFKNTKDSFNSNLWHHEIYFGSHTGWKEKSIEKLTFTSKTQLTLLDMNGTFNVDLFGQDVNENYGFYSPHAVLKGRNSWTLLPSCPLNDPNSDLKISEYHSSAFIDVDGDGRADFLVPCESTKSLDSISLMIFLNLDNQSSLVYHSTISLFPKPISTLSFGDFDGNGSIDMIYASDHGLHVFFNKQRLYCYSSKDVIDDCKDRKSWLFERDEIFGYDTNTNNNSFRLDISNNKLFNNDKLKILGYDYIGAPISLHIGDIQYDGYPDIACIVTSGKPDNNSIVVLKNVPIPDIPERHGYRTFVIDNTITKVLSSSDSPWALSLVDLANDGVMDIIINSKDISNNMNKIIALRSMYYVDAFFINIVVTNGICQAHCPNGERNPRPKPYGVNYPGASFKLSYVDVGGYHRVRMGSQYFQSARMTLMSPSQYLGLGRTNTFIELLAVSTPTKSLNEANWTNVIPNSNLIAFPPYKHNEESHWILELHINPSEYVTWILVALSSCMIVLISIVLILRKLESREDKRERKKALHAINFDAL